MLRLVTKYLGFESTSDISVARGSSKSLKLSLYISMYVSFTVHETNFPRLSSPKTCKDKVDGTNTSSFTDYCSLHDRLRQECCIPQPSFVFCPFMCLAALGVSEDLLWFSVGDIHKNNVHQNIVLAT